MAAGITDRLWEVSDIIDLLEEWEAHRRRHWKRSAWRPGWAVLGRQR
jgi:hypothetical protein